MGSLIYREEKKAQKSNKLPKIMPERSENVFCKNLDSSCVPEGVLLGRTEPDVAESSPPTLAVPTALRGQKARSAVGAAALTSQSSCSGHGAKLLQRESKKARGCSFGFQSLPARGPCVSLTGVSGFACFLSFSKMFSYISNTPRRVESVLQLHLQSLHGPRYFCGF